ncbi:MAG: diacylglycerol kinase [Gammaproteobacteria bacterium]
MRNKFLGTGQKGYRPFRKLTVCLSGLRYAVLYDFSVAYKVILSTLILAICFYYRQWVDLISVFAATGLMLICEMFNTTIEALCDFVETRQNEKIRIIKDIAAAATGISIVIWGVVLFSELGHLWPLVSA